MFNMILEKITPLEKVRHFHHEDTYINLCSQVVCARAVELRTDLYNDLLHSILHSLSFFFFFLCSFMVLRWTMRMPLQKTSDDMEQ